MLAASCSNDEVVNVAENHGAAISFSNFVDKSTRATDYTYDNLENMEVWGVTKFAAGNINVVFNKQLVEKKEAEAGSNWTYSPVQYWIPNNKYSFAAIAPYDNDNVTVTQNSTDVTKAMTNAGLTIAFNNETAKGDLDLLFAASDQDNTQVQFTLGHMLSRVNFKFINEFKSGNYVLAVTDVNITDATSKATIDKTANATVWTVDGEDTFTRAFAFATDQKNTAIEQNANAVSETHYIIPLTVAKSHKVTFKVQLYSKTTDGTLMEITEKAIQHEVTIPAMEFTNGYSYTFVAAINDDNINPNPDEPDVELKPIEFTVTSVSEFTEDENNHHDISPKAGE